jgi:hypothetical protein
MFRWLTAALPAAVVAGCAGIGPATVPHDRIDYGSAIGDSWKEQTLLNIVKLRYADMPIFLEVAQVIAGYQLQSAVTGSVTLGNFTANLVDRLTAAGSATAGGTYTDRPTVVYAPLTGVDFLKRLMTPIPPSSVLFMLQSGYFADRIMPIMLASINGLNNEPNRIRRPADPKFTRLVELMRDGQLAGAIQFRIERAKEGAESSVLIFGPNKDPQLAERGREIKNLLGIRQDLWELRVNYGGYSRTRLASAGLSWPLPAKMTDAAPEAAPFAEMAAHYDTAILPARPRRPRDKAKVEVAVLIIERWLLGRLRHRRFYSLAETECGDQGVIAPAEWRATDPVAWGHPPSAVRRA